MPYAFEASAGARIGILRRELHTGVAPGPQGLIVEAVTLFEPVRDVELGDAAELEVAAEHDEVARAVATFDLAAEEATRLGGEVLDLESYGYKRTGGSRHRAEIVAPCAYDPEGGRLDA